MKITFSIVSDESGIRRSEEHTIEGRGYVHDLIKAFQDAIEFHRLRVEDYNRRFKETWKKDRDDSF